MTDPILSGLVSDPKADPENDPDFLASAADGFIRAEIVRQDAMWGKNSPRSDTQKGELMHAAMAQLSALDDRQHGVLDAFSAPPEAFPETWSGFRDYGSDIANLVVAAAWLRQEIVRKLRNGEDYTRLARRLQEQPYTTLQPEEFHE